MCGWIPKGGLHNSMKFYCSQNWNNSLILLPNDLPVWPMYIFGQSLQVNLYIPDLFDFSDLDLAFLMYFPRELVLKATFTLCIFKYFLILILDCPTKVMTL